MVETAYQTNLFKSIIREISAHEPSPLYEAMEKSKTSVVVFFDGIRGMEEFSRCLKEYLERQNKKHGVLRVHFQQVLFPDPQGWQNQPFKDKDYSQLPLLDKLKQSWVIVDEFSSFDGEKISQALAHINSAPQHVRWVILVPTWRNFSLSTNLFDWALKNNLPQFSLK